MDELDELGMIGLFDGILISSDAGVKKPHKKIFEIASEKFGIELKGSFYIGNDLHDDIFGAHAAGLKTVYIETEQSRKYNELNVLPDFEVKTHEEMMDLWFELSKEKK